jgi:hypothetical protein
MEGLHIYKLVLVEKNTSHYWFFVLSQIRLIVYLMTIYWMVITLVLGSILWEISIVFNREAFGRFVYLARFELNYISIVIGDFTI